MTSSSLSYDTPVDAHLDKPPRSGTQSLITNPCAGQCQRWPLTGTTQTNAESWRWDGHGDRSEAGRRRMTPPHLVPGVYLGGTAAVMGLSWKGCTSPTQIVPRAGTARVSR